MAALFEALADFVPSDYLFHEIKHDAGKSATKRIRALLDDLLGACYLFYIDNHETLQDAQNYSISDANIPQAHQHYIPGRN